MDRKTRLLLIGSSTHRDALISALPNCDVLVAENPLDGVWRGGREDFGRAFVSLGSGNRVTRAVSSLRRLCPNMRIVVGCMPADEPLARRTLTEGADEYVLEPIRVADIKAAYGVRAANPSADPRRFAAPRDATGPSSVEIAKLGEVLRQLDDGPQNTLDRLAKLVQGAFGAAGVLIELDDLAGTFGDVEDPVLEEPIRRLDRPVGRIALARRVEGVYGTGVTNRLTEYSRLIEAIVSQAAEHRRWQNLAWTDDLSRLHNRRYFEHALDELVTRATEKRLRLTVMMFDIDGFKSYNDRFGHDTGDKLIREVAMLLKRCTRRQDIVARYGGDEFTVVFWDAEKQRVPGSVHPSEPIELAQRFCRAIAEHSFECLGRDAPGPVTISGGLASFPWNGNTREELMVAADSALLAAKRTGKNHIHLAGKTDAESAHSA